MLTFIFIAHSAHSWPTANTHTHAHNNLFRPSSPGRNKLMSAVKNSIKNYAFTYEAVSAVINGSFLLRFSPSNADLWQQLGFQWPSSAGKRWHLTPADDVHDSLWFWKLGRCNEISLVLRDCLTRRALTRFTTWSKFTVWIPFLVNYLHVLAEMPWIGIYEGKDSISSFV